MKKKSSFKIFVAYWSSLIGVATAALDIRDFHVYGGLILLGYGLYLFQPGLGFAVPGAIMLIIGVFVGKRGK